MKKKLDVNGIANELKGGSAFFPSYEKSNSLSPDLTPVPEQDQPAENTIIRSRPDFPERPIAPTSVRPNGKRIITRNSFEIYEDQMDSLRQLSYREKMEGKLGSMSNMAREAIDDYLKKRNSTQ